MLDFVCEPLEAGPLSVPAPWLVVDPAYEAYVEWLDSTPLREGRPETLVDDLTVFDGSLYIGLGDYTFNVGSRYCVALGGACPQEDADGHGMPLYRLDPGSSTVAIERVLHEEEIGSFRRTAELLMVPGWDATLGDGPPPCSEDDARVPCPEELAYEYPRFKRSETHLRRGDAWLPESELDLGIHVFDHAVVDGALYAAGSIDLFPDTSAFAAVWRSDDVGSTWDLVFSDEHEEEAFRRMTALVPLGDSIVALGYHGADERNVRFELRDGVWRALPDLLPDLEGFVSSELVDDDLAFVWEAGAGAAAALRPGDDGPVAVPMTFFALRGLEVVDAYVVCRGDLLVLSREGRDTWHVHRTSDLERFRPLVTFEQPDELSAIAAWDGGVVYGGEDGMLHR